MKLYGDEHGDYHKDILDLAVSLRDSLKELQDVFNRINIIRPVPHARPDSPEPKEAK